MLSGSTEGLRSQPPLQPIRRAWAWTGSPWASRRQWETRQLSVSSPRKCQQEVVKQPGFLKHFGFDITDIFQQTPSLRGKKKKVFLESSHPTVLMIHTYRNSIAFKALSRLIYMDPVKKEHDCMWWVPNSTPYLPARNHLRAPCIYVTVMYHNLYVSGS